LARVFVGEGFAHAANVGDAFDATVLASRGAAWIARAAPSLPLGVVLLVEPGNRFRQVATDGELEVHLLAVDHAHRRSGIATALLRECVAEARRRHARALVLSSQPTMQPAHALYEKEGFTRNPKRDWTRGDRTYLVYELDVASE
jgi:ribosomal protein S18 acetylase RimI-like enzyme